MVSSSQGNGAVLQWEQSPRGWQESARTPDDDLIKRFEMIARADGVLWYHDNGEPGCLSD